MSIATLTLLFLGLYLLLLQGVSYLANRLSQQTVEDFFVAGRNTGTIALMGTIVATKVNALALTTSPGLIYEGGILFLQTFIALSVACWLFLYFGPRIWAVCKEHNFLTQGELFGYYYQSPWIARITAIIGILSIFPFLIVQFIAVAKVFSIATDQVISYPIAIGILGFATALYVFLGGARAVIWTDVVQGILLLVLLLVTAILFTHWEGGYGQGWETLTQLIPEKLTFNAQNTPVFWDQVLSWSFAFFLWPQVFQRVMMGKSVKVITIAAWGHFVIGFLVKIALLTIGIMATAALYGQMTDSDQLVAAMFNRHWPIGGCLVTLAVFACGMSTIDSILLTLSSMITRDVVEPMFRLKLTEHQEYRLAQAVALVTLGGSCLFALSPLGSSYLAPLVTLGATVATLLLWPLLGMFSWKKATSVGVMTTLIVGCVMLGGLQLLPQSWQDGLPWGQSTIVFGVSLVSFFGVSQVTQPPVEKELTL